MSTRQISHLADEHAVRAITVPDDTLNSFGRHSRGTWEGLYAWLVAEHGAVENPEPPHPSLHNRVYVGARLMQRLRGVERERLRRKYGYRGKELEGALGWSDFGSGPMEQIGCRRLTGDALVMLPLDAFEERRS